MDRAGFGLRTGVDLLPRAEAQLLVGGKFDNPLMGSVGTHAMLQRRTSTAPSSSR
jgi:hypothetical protein